uniref:Uncharacterized protein n=1 Tax=Macrostomum lignano TaxID=282301 RepID=A0A1I8FYD9_9PLAT
MPIKFGSERSGLDGRSKSELSMVQQQQQQQRATRTAALKRFQGIVRSVVIAIRWMKSVINQ